jgi:lambda family phage portal protein
MGRPSFLRSARTAIARVLAPDHVRRIEAARGDWRRNDRPHFGNPNSEVLSAAPIVRNRARYLVQNNPHAANAVGVYETALVGTGIEGKSAHPNPSTRAVVADGFKRWTQTADADGLTDYFGIQAQVARSLVTDGEAFLHWNGMKLRLLPAEMIDESKSDLSKGDIAGIRFAADGTRIGYWVFKERPQEALNGLTESVLIPAADIIHVFKPTGPGVVRGLPWLAPVAVTISELDQWADAQLLNSKMQAMLTAFLVDQNGTGAPFEGESNPLEISLEPGTMRRLPAGWDVKFSTPQQALASMEFGSFMLRAVAAGLGIPEFLLSGDMRGANFSSMRSALVSFRQRVEQIQFQILVPQLLRPVWERVVTWLVVSGQIDAADFESKTAEYLAADFYPPAPPWVDPLKDAQAQREMVDAGFMSRRQVVASLGFDVEQVDEERAADAKRETGLGLQSAPKASASPEQKQSKTENEESDDEAA